MTNTDSLDQARKISSLALYLVRDKRKPFTSKDKKLHITYDPWTDYLSVFWHKISPVIDPKSEARLVFCMEMGVVKQFNEGDEEWQIRLIEENGKRQKN